MLNQGLLLYHFHLPHDWDETEKEKEKIAKNNLSFFARQKFHWTKNEGF